MNAVEWITKNKERIKHFTEHWKGDGLTKREIADRFFESYKYDTHGLSFRDLKATFIKEIMQVMRESR